MATNGDAPNGQPDPAPPPAINIRRLGAFEDFMTTGDLPTPVSATAAQRAAVQRAAFSPTTPSPGPASAAPDAAAAASVPPAAGSSPTQSTAPAAGAVSAPAPAGPDDSSDAGSFLTGLFRKAATTLESTLESAKRDIARNPVISTASESFAELSHAFMAESDPGTLSGDAPVSADDRPTAPAKTTSLRSLKLNHATGAGPVLLFVGGPARDVFVVTETSVEAFAWDGPKILQHNFTEAWGPDADAPPATASPGGGSSPPRRVRASRNNSRAPDDVVPVRSAVHLPATEEILVGLADGSLRVFSVRSGQMGEPLRQTPSSQAVVSALCAQAAGAVVGREDGSLSLVKLDTLAPATSLSAPAMTATPLAAETRHPPVTCAYAADGSDPLQAGVVVGYADGTVAARKFADPTGGVAFAAHAGGVGGVLLMFGGAVVVSIGSEEDPSLCTTVASTGRCLLRRMLPYTPTSLCAIPTAAPAAAAPGPTPAPGSTSAPVPSPAVPTADAAATGERACPSEGAILVGGSDGELDVFRLVALSAHQLEFRLLRRISERSRGRRKAVVMSTYSVEDGLLLALARGGEVRRWRLSAADASLLALPSSARPQYTSENVRAALGGARTDAEETRLAVGEGVIAAQRVLAGVLEDDVGVDEAGKDALVEQFQRMQAEMQDTASQNDGELRRARLRIARRFAGVVETTPPAADDAEKCIGQAALRCAALELNAACDKHASKLATIRAATVRQLRVVLLQSLRGATGAAERVGAIRRAAEDLAQISPEV